jgi:hypothetical protein
MAFVSNPLDHLSDHLTNQISFVIAVITVIYFLLPTPTKRWLAAQRDRLAVFSELTAKIRLRQINSLHTYYVALHDEPHRAVIAAIYQATQTTTLLAVSILILILNGQAPLGRIFALDQGRLFSAIFFGLAALYSTRISAIMRVMQDFDKYEKYVETQRAKLQQRIR